jgi:hypothetical protein
MKRGLLTIITCLLVFAVIAQAQTKDITCDVIAPNGMLIPDLEVKAEMKIENGVTFVYVKVRNRSAEIKKLMLAVVEIDDQGDIFSAPNAFRPGISFISTIRAVGSLSFGGKKTARVALIVQRVEVESGVYEWPLPESLEETSAVLRGEGKRATFTPKQSRARKQTLEAIRSKAA